MKDKVNSIDAGNFSDTYERYCRELDKEDKVLNDRVNWLLVSQSILFAAVGFSGEGPGKIIVKIVPWLGCALSAAIAISVVAAISSYLRYRSLLIESCPADCVHDVAYPQLRRSTNPIAIGFAAPILLPAIFGVAWALVAQI